MHRAPLYAKCVVFMSIAQRRKRPCRCFVAIVLRLAQLSAAPQIFPAIPRIFMSALRSQSTNDELAAAAVRPFCPSRRVFSSPQRKVCIAAAVVGSHSTLFHAQPSQSSRTISEVGLMMTSAAAAIKDGVVAEAGERAVGSMVTSAAAAQVGVRTAKDGG